MADEAALKILVSLSVATAAAAAKAVTKSAALGAAMLAVVVLWCGGWGWGAPVLAFFVSSSALTRLLDEDRSDHDIRRFGQVAANGFVAAVAALMFGITGHIGWAGAFVGSLSAANADTWATEIGCRFGGIPRNVLTFQKMSVGDSGGVTLIGTFGTMLGAVAIAFVAMWTMPVLSARFSVIPLMVVAGFAGSVVDSILGATMERKYWCVVCDKVVERDVHCDQPSIHNHGVLTNNHVNLACTVVGGAVGWWFASGG